jgi:hypothetical protein
LPGRCLGSTLLKRTLAFLLFVTGLWGLFWGLSSLRWLSRGLLRLLFGLVTCDWLILDAWWLLWAVAWLLSRELFALVGWTVLKLQLFVKLLLRDYEIKFSDSLIRPPPPLKRFVY